MAHGYAFPWGSYGQFMPPNRRYYPYYPPQNQTFSQYDDRPSKKTIMNPSKAKCIRKAKKNRKPLNLFRDSLRVNNTSKVSLLAQCK